MRNLLSTLLLVAAVILFAVAGWTWYQDRQQADDLAPVPVIAGQAELKNVVDALRAQDVEVAYGQQAIFSETLIPPGQALVVNGDPLYVFIFENLADRQAQTGDAAAADIPLLSALGTPVAGNQIQIAQGSNVLTVLVSDNAETAAAVQAALATLP